MQHTNLICSLMIAAGPLFGEVKIQLREGRPIVDGVYVNGHGPYRFLVDTGAHANLIEANLAVSIGLTPTLQTELASPMGVTIVPGSDGVQVTLGSATADRQEFLFLGLEAIHSRWPDIQGVLGQWFLSRFDYTLDLRAKRLEFGKQDRKGARTRFTMNRGRPMIATSLGDLLLDSGAAQLVLFGVKPEPGHSDRGELRTNAGSQQVGMVFSKPLTIENRKIWRGDAVAIPNRPEPGVDGVMPLSLFKGIYVCNSEGYVVFD